MPMTATTRGQKPAERKPVASSQGQSAAAGADLSAVGRRMAADATASTKSAIRGRLAERMAQIANKVAAPTQSKTPASAQSSVQAPAPQQAASPAPAAELPHAADAPAPAPETTTAKAHGAQARKAAPSGSPARAPWADRLKAEYQSLLRKVHERVLDAPREQLFFVPTKEPAALSGLTITSPNRASGHDYRPVPTQVFDWALAQIEEDLSQFTFVDYGAGKGRAMLLAAEHPFAAVAGVEFALELHDNAEMNIAQYPRSNMRCRNVECVLEDAVQVGPPEGSSVHYFFNPFARGVFAEVLNNIVMAYRMKPRRLYLVLIDPVATDLVDASGVFARVEPSQVDALKLRLFSPHTVTIYRSLA